MKILNRPLQRGVSLIEVMVSVLILAVGLLGLAALLGNAMQSNQHASARTQAVFLAGDMMERMRANRNNSPNYVFDGMDDPGGCNYGWTPDNAATVASNDLSEWQNALRCHLPNGNGLISVLTDSEGNTIVTVGVDWVAIDEEDDDDGRQSRERVTIVSQL